jgi:hypothetical protein
VQISATSFFLAAMTTPSQLPLKTRQALRDSAEECRALAARVSAATGVEGVQWPIEADVRLVLAHDGQPLESVVNALKAYIEALAELLEGKCKDELVRECVAESLSQSKTVGVRLVADLEAVIGQQVHSLYNGVQFDRTGLFIITTPAQWYVNCSDVRNLDIAAVCLTLCEAHLNRCVQRVEDTGATRLSVLLSRSPIQSD